MIERKLLLTRAGTVVAVCGLVAVVVVYNLRAQGDDQAKVPKTPTAEAVLKEVSAFYKKTKSFTVHIQRVQKVGILPIPASFEVAMERPNKLVIRNTGLMGATVVSDGKSLFMAMPALGKYTQAEAPASLDDLTA